MERSSTLCASMALRCSTPGEFANILPASVIPCHQIEHNCQATRPAVCFQGRTSRTSNPSAVCHYCK
eukprot:13202-Pleurochrysis_carterae.AAC.1